MLRLLFYILVIAGWMTICAIWAGLLLAQFRAQRRGLFLEARPMDQNNLDVRKSPLPTVCVVIPARNEGHQIEGCLASVLAQDYSSFEVLLIDDRSDDDTGVVADRIAGTDQRLRVRRLHLLPSGWLGKSHALWLATRDVRTDWILFLDADCILAPFALRVAVEEAIRRGAGLLTLWPRNRAEGFWEHLLIPLCAGIIALWYGTNRANEPGSPLAFANGQFLLFRRDEYERVGGHYTVRGAVTEDLALAEAAKHAGVRCHVASGCELFSVRMYSDFMSLRDGWARIYVGALRSGVKIAMSVAWLAVGSLLPFVATLLLFAPIDAQLVFPGTGPLLIASLRTCCALHLVLLFIVSYRFWGFGGCRRSYLILYPISVVVVLQILSLAWWRLVVRQSITWSSTHYRINRRGVIVEP